MKHKIALALTLLVIGLGLTVSAGAQGRFAGGKSFKQLVDDARNGRIKVDKESLARVNEAYAAKSDDQADAVPPFFKLTGTWYMTVPTGPNPEDVFNAYQTFGEDGTMSETSSILGTLVEGPAHGVYERHGRGYLLTFELFAFDQDNGGVVAGRYRVRCFIQLTGANTLQADTALDIIELDGTVIPDVAAGPFTGERVQVRSL
jgi:hypothetical protein